MDFVGAGGAGAAFALDHAPLIRFHIFRLALASSFS